MEIIREQLAPLYPPPLHRGWAEGGASAARGVLGALERPGVASRAWRGDVREALSQLATVFFSAVLGNTGDGERWQLMVVSELRGEKAPSPFEKKLLGIFCMLSSDLPKQLGTFLLRIFSD